MPEVERDERAKTSADCLLRFFTATERLLQAADEVRRASDAIMATGKDKSAKEEVRG